MSTTQHPHHPEGFCTVATCETSQRELAQVQGREAPAPKTDMVDLIIRHEDGELGVDETLELFSELIRTGQAWTLQGSYGRTARGLIDRHYIAEDGTVLYAPEGE